MQLYNTDIMKKFLIYSFGITVIAILFGVLSVYGFFDISDGKAQLIGTSKLTITDVDIHNQIVTHTHSIGLDIRDLNEIFQSFQTDSDVNILKEKIDTIEQQKKLLEDYMARNSFRRNKQKIEDTFSEKYIPSVSKYENTYKKIFSYASTKPFDETSLNSFKDSANRAFQNYINAHNTFVDELNRVRRY